MHTYIHTCIHACIQTNKTALIKKAHHSWVCYIPLWRTPDNRFASARTKPQAPNKQKYLHSELLVHPKYGPASDINCSSCDTEIFCTSLRKPAEAGMQALRQADARSDLTASATRDISGLQAAAATGPCGGQGLHAT